MKAYLILDLAIIDVRKFMDYVKAIPAIIEKHAGRYIVQGEVPTVIEGGWAPERVVVIEFPSRDQANNFLQDPEAQSLFKIRHASTDSKLILVDGCA